MKQKDTQGGERWGRTAWDLAGCSTDRAGIMKKRIDVFEKKTAP